MGDKAISRIVCFTFVFSLCMLIVDLLPWIPIMLFIMSILPAGKTMKTKFITSIMSNPLPLKLFFPHPLVLTYPI